MLGGENMLCAGAMTSEDFGKANAIRHPVELEFLLNIFFLLWKYEKEGKVQKRQAVADQLAETRMKAYSCGQVPKDQCP